MRISDGSSDVCASDLAWGFDSGSGPMELNIPAIKGIGDSLIYLVDRWQGKNGHGGTGDISIYDVDFEPIDADTGPAARNRYAERRVRKEVVSTGRSRWSP